MSTHTYASTNSVPKLAFLNVATLNKNARANKISAMMKAYTEKKIKLAVQYGAGRNPDSFMNWYSSFSFSVDMASTNAGHKMNTNLKGCVLGVCVCVKSGDVGEKTAHAVRRHRKGTHRGTMNDCNPSADTGVAAENLMFGSVTYDTRMEPFVWEYWRYSAECTMDKLVAAGSLLFVM